MVDEREQVGFKLPPGTRARMDSLRLERETLTELLLRALDCLERSPAADETPSSTLALDQRMAAVDDRLSAIEAQLSALDRVVMGLSGERTSETSAPSKRQRARRITDAKRAQVLKLAARAPMPSQAEIAKAAGVGATTVARILAGAGIDARPQRRLDPAQKAEIAKLHAEGLSGAEIVRRTGLPETTVRNLLRKLQEQGTDGAPASTGSTDR